MLVDPGTVAQKADPEGADPVLKFKQADPQANPDPPDVDKPKPVDPDEGPANHPQE